LRVAIFGISVAGNLIGATEAGIRAHRIKIGNLMTSVDELTDLVVAEYRRRRTRG
jgi:hypothetical protein